MDTLLDIRDLRIGFRQETAEKEVVHGISFQINKGGIVGLVGESGSGKSVTALSLMRLLPPASRCRISGAVDFYEGEKSTNLFACTEAQMRHYRGARLSMIFQEPMTSLNPVFTCGRQVTEAIAAHKQISRKEAKRQVLALFEQVRLRNPAEVFSRYPHQLSGGQKQRVMIAMALSCEPDLIIADEPTTALDVTVQKAILDLLKALQQQLQISVLFITHDLGVVHAIADEVLVMYKGSIVEQGSVTKLFTHPEHPYTKGLLACRPPTDRILKKLPVMTDFIEMKEGKMVSRQTDMAALIRSLELPPRPEKPPSEAAPILRVENLQVGFAGRRNFLGRVMQWTTAVRDVSFTMQKGEVLGLAGESGCGKTTLGRALLQLVRPQSGSVWYRGTDLCTLSKSEMRRWRPKMQLIFQDPYAALNPRLTIGEALMEPMRVHKLYGNDRNRRNRIRQLLKKVDLDPAIVNGYPHEFSGGQRQRICIARALALQPEFIICDESVSALDVSVQAQVLNLLRQLKEEFGFSCIFISHDLSVVKFMCDRILIMNQGRIAEIGPAETVFHTPRSSYTRKLLAAIPH